MEEVAGPGDWVASALDDAPVARLGTCGADGTVCLVPICFAVVEGWAVSAVDHKPKRTGQLRRLDDIERSGRATLLVDHYEDDWSRLWWVRVSGRAEVLPDAHDAVEPALDALRAKYHQYRDQTPRGPVYRIALDELRWWRPAS